MNGHVSAADVQLADRAAAGRSTAKIGAVADVHAGARAIAKGDGAARKVDAGRVGDRGGGGCLRAEGDVDVGDVELAGERVVTLSKIERDGQSVGPGAGCRR